MRSARSSRAFPRALIVWAASLLWLGCGDENLTAPETGRITVTSSTTGSPQDPDGYAVTVDNGEPRPIGANATITVSDLPPGDHVVGLGEAAENCLVAGENPRTVAVPAGQEVELTFEVVCATTVGGLTVTTSTTGPSPDPDGYTIRVDEAAEQPIGANASVTIVDLSPGSHAVELGGVATNCQVEGDNPRSAEVAAGQTGAVEFQIACTAGVRRWNAMASGTDADLSEVWVSSSPDAFAVGEVPFSDEPQGASVILRFDGSGWVRQHRETNLVLRGVWGSSPSNVFAVGFNLFSPGNDIARLLQYDGSQWSDVPGFTSEFEDLGFQSVWGSSATDVFAVGGAFDGEFDRSLIFHFDGTSWQRMPQPSPVAPSLFDVWGSSAENVYAVGQDEEADPANGVILQYDGAVWSPVVVQEGLFLTSVWGSSASDVFAAGFRVEEVGDDFRVIGTILHYDGTSWSRMSLPAAGVLNDLWGTSASDVFAVGDEGVVLHYDGAEWTRTRPTRRALLGVWGSSASDVFAVGEGGTILRGSP